MLNDIEKLLEESSRDLPSEQSMPTWSDPTTKFTGQKPDLGEDIIFRERVKYGLTAPIFKDGKWLMSDTSDISREQFGDEALAFTIGEGTKGWGERSIQADKRLIDQFNNEGNSMFDGGNRETAHTEQFFEGFNFFGDENETYKTADEIKKKIEYVDPNWTDDKRFTALTEWQKANPEVNRYLATAGVNVQDYILNTRNSDAFMFAINEAIQRANIDIRMRLYETDNGTISKIGNAVVEGIKDPLMVRDIVLSSIATLGVGGIATVAGLSARALAGGVATGVNAARAVKGLEVVRKAANAAALATGPMTGLIEGPAYAAIRTIVPSAGRSAVSTLSSRGLALALEGGVAGAVSSYADQKASHEWRSLVFQDTDKAFKHNLGETAMGALTGALGSVGLAATFRFGLGAVGDYKYYKTGDWDGFRRQIANSMDTWATTKDGDIVWGNTLSDGRGIFFGDVVDNIMKKYDGRDFTNVMLNGSRLFGTFNQRIAGKMNLDINKALPVIEEFEKATGVAGEAAMLRVDGVAPETRRLFDMILSESNLDDADLSLDDVTALLKDYNANRSGELFGPREVTAADVTLAKLEPATEQVEVARQIQRLIGARSLDRKLETIGVSSSNVINNAEKLLGRDLNLANDVDFGNFITAAKFAAASVDEAQVVSTMKRITSGDFGGGRTIPQEVVQSIFKSAFGDKPIVVTASGTNKNFAVVVDPKTGEVFASGRTLKTGKNGNLEIELRADDATSKFFTDDTTTVDTETFKAKLVEVNEKLNEAWSKGVKEKVKKVIDSVKKPKAKEKLAATFAEGKEVTVDNIKDVFDLTKSEAVAAKIIFDALGYEGDSGMLRIARFAADDRNAEIVLEGSTALIKATKSADMGTITHEMSHYLQVMVLDNLDAEARHAIGITDDMWTKFKDWVGFTGDEWSEAAAEKFANGMSQYVRRVMSGDGRAPTTQVQRLFHRVGDHLGKIGDRFKTQEALEAGLTMSAEAEAVFEALFNRSNSKVGELFDAAYQNLFKRLPKEQRHQIGKEILGEVAFNDYLAKQEIKTEKAKRVIDPLAVAASVKTESTTSIINSIYEGVNKSVTRKHIKEAITVAGYTKEEYIADVNKLRDAVIGQTNVTSTKPARLDSASHLSDDELTKFFAQLSEAGGIDESLVYIGVVTDFDVRLGVLSAGRDLSTLEELGGKIPENPVWGLTTRNEKKKFYSKDALLKEINRRRDAGISKTEKSITVSSETLQSIDDLLAETGFVDNAGLSVSLTPTEAIVATRMAEASQASRNAVAHMETVITALNEERPLDAAKAEKTETVTPEVVNVEDRPVDMRGGLSSLGTIAEAARVETDRLGSLIPEARTKEAKAIAAAVVADPSRAEKILDEYQELLSTFDSGTQELTKQYIAAELRARISSVTIERIAGMDDKAFKRFTELNELYERIENIQNEQAIEMVIRDPSRENINNAIRALGWSESDVSLYAVGRYQLTNGSLVAEFIDAKRYVEANINTVKENITKLKEREAEYKSAVARRDVAKRGELVLTKEESDKLDAFISKYDKMKYSVSRFNNAAERVKRGVLRPESVDVIDADMKLKADAPEIKTEWLKLANLDRSPKLVKLIYAKIDQADPVKILKVLDEKIETLSDKVSFDGESSLPNWSAMSPIEKAQAWARGDAKSAAASAFVKTVINGEESNAKRKGKTKKGITGDVEAPEDRGDSLIDTGTAIKARETKEDSRDFYYNLEEEVGSIRYVSNLFYHYLLDVGKDELAKVFMARKEAMMYKGSKIESTTRILENYGITMTEGTLDNRITSLADEFDVFTSMLPEEQAEGLKRAFKLRKVKSKTLAQSKVVGEMTDEQLDELDALLNTMQPGDMIQAPDFLIKTVTESSSNLYRKIASGEIETVGAAIREIANSKTSKFAALAELLLSEKQDILDGMGLHLAIYAKDDFTGGAFAGNNVFLNAREGKVNVTTLIHETIHAITANDLDSYGFIESGADSYIKQLNDALSNGKGPNGKQISDGARSIIKAYLNALKWVDETPMALDILGTDYKSKLVGQTMVSPETSTHYALSNIHEFVAVVLTDVSAVKFFGAIPAEQVAESRPVKEMLLGVAKTLWPQGKDLEIQRRADFLRKQVLADLAAGALTSKVDVPDPLDALLPPLMPGTTPFRLIGNELVKTEGIEMAGLLRANLKAAKGRVYAQLRAMNLQEQFVEAAKAAGADAAAFEAKLSELVDSAEVRRRNLLAAGLHEEMEPEDLEIIQSMINGTKAFTQPATTHLTKRMKSAVTPSTMPTKFVGKSYRDLTDDERRDFVSTVLLPTIENKMGRRNRSAGLYSMITDSKVGKSVNSLIGGGAAYGDTADADSLLLQFFSKVYDPLMDLRDGELSGVFDLFSVDLVNAETNNMYSRAGLLNIQRKIMAQVSKTPDLEKLYETAWMYLGNLEELPEGIAHRELIVELIKGVHKYNTIVGDTLKKYGTLDEAMDPAKYGTIHKVNMLAFEEQERFVEALVKHALIKERASKELSIVTMDAMGWVKLTRDSVSDDIKSVSIPEDSPLKSVFKEEKYDYSEFKKIALKSSISGDLLKLYEDGLTSSKNYKNWDIYKSRGDGYTAIRHTMTVAKNRYLDIESAESRGGKPRTEGVGGGRDMDITRILSHEEITKNPELARYFDKDIFGLINQQLRSSVTDAIMTKYISEMFGVKMSWLDLIEVSRKHGEASRGQLTKSEQDSVNRGYDRIKTIWEANTGKMLASRDGLDRHYRSLLETGSRPLVLAASGLRAAVTSTGETVRAILSSNHNRGMLRQVLPNFITTLKLFSRNKRQTIQQIASSTHWIRGLSSDHLLLRAEMNPNNPFGGTIMGSTQGGWFKRWASAWQGVKERNKLEDSIVGKAANYLSVPASKLGSPLAFINDVTTTLHVYNLQNNLTNNSSKFLALAKLLQESEPESVAEFKELARRAGLSTKEAIDLSSMGLLDPKRIEVMIEAAKDQTNYMEGMLDVQRLYIWAGEDPVKIDTINRMGSLINATARHTNTDPTLLDLRINQSAYARSMGVFMQFLLSHSAQEIGRRRRYTTTAYSKHLAGLVMMESIAYSLARTKDEDDDKWIWEDTKEKPFQTVVKLGTSLPLLGSYQYLSALLRAGILETHSQLTGEKSDERFRAPDLYSGPSENIPRRTVDMIKDLL